MAYPDFNLVFILYTDASDFRLGAVVSQKTDRKERLIACASSTLNKSEKSYSFTKQCLAVVWAIKYFQSYLMGWEFTVFTDHYSLKWSRKDVGGKCPAPQMAQQPGGIQFRYPTQTR